MIAEVIADKYEVLSELGRGGMGRVYKVLHRGLNKVYALKALHEHLVDDESLITRFQNEARIMASLHHVNIIQVFDIDRDGNRHYFVMEYIEGQTLGDVLKERTPLPIAEVITISRQMGQALNYAHQRQPPIIHRDIKPSNIMLEAGTNRVVVTDFGIAKLLDAERTRLTQSGMVVGTPTYAAPEQLRSLGNLDGRADIFPLGLVMYEMLAGRSFYNDMTPEEIIGQKLFDPRELMPVFDGSVPSAIQQLIKRAIAKDREQRYPSVAALLEDLDRLESNGLAIGKFKTPTKPSRKGYWLAVLGVTVLAGLAGYWWWVIVHHPDPKPLPLPVSGPEQQPGSVLPVVEPEPEFNASGTHAVRVEISDSAEATTERDWQVEVLNANRVPIIHRSASTQADLVSDTGAAEIHVKTSDPDGDPLSFVWTLDGKTLEENQDQLRLEGLENGDYRIGVTVRDGNGGSVNDNWQLKINKPAPSPVLNVAPAKSRIVMTACAQQVFRVNNPTIFTTLQWSLNAEKQPESGPQFTFEPQQAGGYTLQILAVAGTETLSHSWRIEVRPVPITEADVQSWINNYQHALQNQDAQALRQLGTVFSEQELAQLQTRQRYQVTLEPWNAVERGGVVELSFSQIERWYNPQTYSSVVEHSAQAFKLQHQRCGDIVAVRK